MNDFTKAEKVAVKYLLEWGQHGDIDFPDSVVTSYFDLLTGDSKEQNEAIKNLCGYVKSYLGEEKSIQVERELLSCIA